MANKPYYAVSNSPWLRPLLASPLGALAVHWVFQCMPYMDATERRFKLGIELALFLLVLGFLGPVLPSLVAVMASLLVAHTLNLVLNGHAWVVMKHFGRLQHSQKQFNREIRELSDRIARERCIVFAAAYGSLARGQWSPTSDLDVRLVRAPGLPSALRVCWFALRERARAFWRRFPLDLYVLDSYASLDKLVERDVPVILGRAQAEQIKDGKADDKT